MTKKCKTCLSGYPSVECVNCGTGLRNYRPYKPPTNADRIRGMNDEELARWLVDATVCERVCDEDEYCHGNECVKRVTDWLQQPYGGIDNG